VSERDAYSISWGFGKHFVVVYIWEQHHSEG